jgi:pyruvate-formate lyase-activating enzyme
MVIARKIRESSNGLNGEKFEKEIVETGSLTLRDFKRWKSSSTPKPIGKSNKQKLENLFHEMLNKGIDEDKTLAEYIKERS